MFNFESTAELLAELLRIPVSVDRSEFRQSVDDLALAFRLKQRPPEGKILTISELEAVGYQLRGNLKRAGRQARTAGHL